MTRLRLAERGDGFLAVLLVIGLGSVAAGWRVFAWSLAPQGDGLDGMARTLLAIPAMALFGAIGVVAIITAGIAVWRRNGRAKAS